MLQPGQFTVYKSTAVMKAGLILPDWGEEKNGKRYLEKEGSIYIEATKALGKQTYDWNNKVGFAISANDICNLMSDNTEKHRLFHQWKGTNKTFQPFPGRDGSMMIAISNGDNKITIPLDSGEWRAFQKLIKAALPVLIGWNVAI